jgi:hypothetical protein
MDFFYPEDGCDTILTNVGSHKIYIVPHPIRRHSSIINSAMEKHGLIYRAP